MSDERDEIFHESPDRRGLHASDKQHIKRLKDKRLASGVCENLDCSFFKSNSCSCSPHGFSRACPVRQPGGK